MFVIDEEQEAILKKDKGMNMIELKDSITHSYGEEQQIYIDTLEAKLGKRVKIILEKA